MAFRSKKWIRLALAAIGLASAVFLLALAAASQPPLLPGVDTEGPKTAVDERDIRLLLDVTAFDSRKSERVFSQQIFDQILAMVGHADRLLFVDLFLWNPWQGSIPEDHRALASELAEALITRKNQVPDLEIVVLTDPINRIYGEMEPVFFRRMATAGIHVLFTPHSRLRDSNRAWAALWRPAEALLDSTGRSRAILDRPRFGNPFDRGGKPISLRQFGRMLLFKANHRKVVIAGSDRYGLEALVGSLNPADGSSAHSNLALYLTGNAALDALASETALARWAAETQASQSFFSGSKAMGSLAAVQDRALALARPERPVGSPSLQWLSEGAIARSLVERLSQCGEGDTLRIAMFYLSDRRVVDALAGAAGRGAEIRLILDANRDAFGMRKIGIPNRPVAAELLERGGGRVQVRWADTHGEQFHTKALSIANPARGESTFAAGSANWTRRNIGNLNLEANLLVENHTPLTEEFNRYFDRAWDNSDGLSYTLPYESWAEKGFTLAWKTALYRFQEWSGMCTF